MKSTSNLRAMVPLLLFMVIAIAFGLASCSSDGSAGQQDPDGSGDLTDVTHSIEPTDQMREVAEQQCLDDEELAEGYVRAVSPDTEEILAEISVDCSEVRS